jgi:hypothetical protein
MTKTTKPAPMLGMPKGEHEQPVVLAPSDSRPRQSPSALWAAVTPEDIGEGFVPIESFDRPAPVKTRPFFEVREFKNKFVSGSSSFVSYEVKPRLVKKQPKTKARTPFNSHTKITKTEKVKFAQQLEKNISVVNKLFLNEVLPVTLSIKSAIEDTKEKTVQLVGEAIDLPMDFYMVKAMQAVQLRIIRQLVEDFKLTPAEANLMVAEFLPRLPKAEKKE